jgi:hypothetical protein
MWAGTADTAAIRAGGSSLQRAICNLSLADSFAPYISKIICRIVCRYYKFDKNVI